MKTVQILILIIIAVFIIVMFATFSFLFHFFFMIPVTTTLTLDGQGLFLSPIIPQMWKKFYNDHVGTLDKEKGSGIKPKQIHSFKRALQHLQAWYCSGVILPLASLICNNFRGSCPLYRRRLRWNFFLVMLLEPFDSTLSTFLMLYLGVLKIYREN